MVIRVFITLSYDIGHSLEANCLRKIGLSTSSLTPRRNIGKTQAFFMDVFSQTTNSTTFNNGSEIHQVLGTVDLSHRETAIYCPCSICVDPL